jgi:hypothetical protein
MPLRAGHALDATGRDVEPVPEFERNIVNHLKTIFTQRGCRGNQLSAIGRPLPPTAGASAWGLKLAASVAVGGRVRSLRDSTPETKRPARWLAFLVIEMVAGHCRS